MGRGTRKQTKHEHEPNLNLKTKYDLNARFFKLQKYFFLKKVCFYTEMERCHIIRVL